MDRQTLRDWVLRFNESGPDGLKDLYKGAPGRKLNDAQLAELAQIVEAGPRPFRVSVKTRQRLLPVDRFKHSRLDEFIKMRIALILSEMVLYAGVVLIYSNLLKNDLGSLTTSEPFPNC